MNAKQEIAEYLSEHDTFTSVDDIQGYTQYSRATIYRVLRQLERDGVVDLFRDENDKRYRLVNFFIPSDDPFYLNRLLGQTFFCVVCKKERTYDLYAYTVSSGYICDKCAKKSLSFSNTVP